MAVGFAPCSLNAAIKIPERDMGFKLFLSHDHRDDELARIIASTLSRITLGQVEVWFSSDNSPSGGIRPGSVWLDEVKAQLERSKAILILLTPNSLDKPWVLFESGFGAAIPNCEVIPLCVGINAINDVPVPLAMYQCYQLVGYASLRNFVSKLLSRYEINFDEEMAKPVLEKAISEFAKNTANDEASSKQRNEISLIELSDDIKQHLDRRFMELVERQQLSSMKSGNEPSESALASYSVPVHIDFTGHKSTQYLEIDNKTTLFEVLNNIYFMIADSVEPFSYLRSWILEEAKSKVKLVVFEVSQLIPAKFIFTPGSEWKALGLSKPYSIADSADFRRWYRSGSNRPK
jgi:hypothetical protein